LEPIGKIKILFAKIKVDEDFRNLYLGKWADLPPEIYTIRV